MIKEIGLFLRAHRRSAKMSQDMLADISGVSRTAIQRIERGEDAVQFDTVVKICKSLNISVSFTGPLGIEKVMHAEDRIA